MVTRGRLDLCYPRPDDRIATSLFDAARDSEYIGFDDHALAFLPTEVP
jgi:hypothetical protein